MSRNTERPSVRDVTVESIAPEVQDREVSALLPTVVKPSKASFVLGGVNVAIANGLRRVMSMELPVYGLTFDYSSFKTNSPFMLNYFLKTGVM